MLGRNISCCDNGEPLIFLPGHLAKPDTVELDTVLLGPQRLI